MALLLSGADDGSRTHGLLVGNETLYLLSYIRMAETEGFEPSVV
jgi:hypothetical protein